MNREDRLKYCRKCINKKFDNSKGIMIDDSLYLIDAWSESILMNLFKSAHNTAHHKGHYKINALDIL